MAKENFCYLNEFKDILEESQHGKHNHLLKRARKIYENSENEDEILTTITHLLRHFLVVGGREPNVDRAFQFISLFLHDVDKNKQDSEESGENGLVVNLISFLVELHNVNCNNVRFRSCQLLSILLADMNDDTAIDDNLHENIRKASLASLKDKTPIVRQYAVRALTRLQDPQNPNCSIIKEFLFHLERDPCSDVRVAILRCIGASKQILPRILDRTRDVKENVRKAAYTFLAEKVHFRCLTIAQRAQLLREGLRDRADVVQKCVSSKLIPAWIKLCNGSEVKLLSYLDVENFTESCEILMDSILKEGSIKSCVERFLEIKNQEKFFTITEENVISNELAFYMRIVAQYTKSQGNDEAFETMFPELIHFCEYVENVIKQFPDNSVIENQLNKEFILKELIFVMGTYEIVDDPSRNAILQFVRKLLTSSMLSFGVIGPLINLSVSAFDGDEVKSTTFAVEIISDIRQPIISTQDQTEVARTIQQDLELAKVRVELNELREKLQISASKQLFLEAAEFQKQIEEAREKIKELSYVSAVAEISDRTIIDKNDSETWCKALTVACELLKQPQVRTMSPSLRSLVEDLLLPGIQNSDPKIRNLAVESLGLTCLLDKEMAQEKALLFLQILQIDQETIRLTSAKCLFDFLIVFGVDAFDPEESSDIQTNKEQSKIISVLTLLLDNEDSDVRAVIVEGLGKLLLFDCINSSKLLSRLILLWYNPITDDDSVLRHLLGVFLPLYASLSNTHQQCIEQAFLPTLNTIFEAPKSSPLANVDPMNVAKFMVALTHSKMIPENRKTANSENVENIHFSLALRICAALLNEIRFHYIRVYTKTLTLLDFNGCDDVDLRQLINLHSQVSKVKMEKTSARMLVKFREKLMEAGCKETEAEVNVGRPNDESEKIIDQAKFPENRTLYRENNFTLLEESMNN